MPGELKILIIEDVPRDAEAIEEQLHSEGVQFLARRVETRSGLEEELKHHPPDIILSDFTLPDFDAMQALAVLQKQRPDIPFILVTGNRSEEVAVECIKEGADDYILKASLKRLPSSISNVLRKRAAEAEKARAEEALRRSEEQYRLIAENTRDLISLLDPAGRFLYASPSFRHNLGYKPEALLGTDCFELIHPEDQAAVRTVWHQTLQNRSDQSVEFRIRNHLEEWRIFEAVGSWIFDANGQPQRSVFVSRDITERKRAEEALRGLPRVIIDAQEAERRRVARELHDSVNQILSSVKFRLQAVAERLLDNDEAAARDAAKAKTLLEKAMQEVRRISRNLRPSELDDLGLLAAVRTLCDEFAEQTGLNVVFTGPRLGTGLAKEVELNFYRILQEALTNIEKHSGATEVRVHLQQTGGAVVLTVHDNGHGFDRHDSARRRSGGMGLVDMTERAHSLHGTFQLDSAPATGTTLRVRVPTSSHDHPKPKTGEKKRKEKDQAPARG